MIIVDGAKIKDLRLKNGLILDTLAKSIGSTPTMLNQVENGDKQPSVRLLKTIADYFELPTDDFIIKVDPYKSAQR